MATKKETTNTAVSHIDAESAKSKTEALAQGAGMNGTDFIEHRIVIADNGWVFTGAYTRPVPDRIRLLDASVIRIWGTNAGLGQLALHGKRKETVLDPCGIVDVPIGSVVATMVCNEPL